MYEANKAQADELRVNFEWVHHFANEERTSEKSYSTSFGE
jgi:hypothetical protein